MLKLFAGIIGLILLVPIGIVLVGIIAVTLVGGYIALVWELLLPAVMIVLGVILFVKIIKRFFN